jgi:hypothetical protein
MNPAINLTAAALLFAASLLATSARAETIGYWRFESGATEAQNAVSGSYTLVKTGNGTVTGSLGDIPATIPQTGAANTGAISFNGTTGLVTTETGDDADAFRSTTFTLEMFITPGSLATNQLLAGVFTATANQRSWGIMLHTDATIGLALGDSGGKSPDTSNYPRTAFTFATGKTWYIAISVDITDTSASGITFYIKNLTDGGAPVTESFTHSYTSLYASGAGFSIGSQGNGTSSGFTGIIDEVRYSNTRLEPDQLLINTPNIPEPAAAPLLLATLSGLLVLVARSRRAPRV